MHRSPKEYLELTESEKLAIWACMDVAIDRQKQRDSEAKRKMKKGKRR